MTGLAAALDLRVPELWALAAICLGAGLVRGFAGFALSALILPPVELIPLSWWLEVTASLLMLRGGWRDADRRMVAALTVTSFAGLPVGLMATVTIAPDLSRLLALGIVAVLAAMQMARLRPAVPGTRGGPWGTGFVSGVVTGLAGVGGMVVALYVLARDAPARQMRAALVLFILLGELTTLLTFRWFGMMDESAVRRGLVLAVPAGFGVRIGARLFIPRLEPCCRPFCLVLLIGLAGAGLVRLMW